MSNGIQLRGDWRKLRHKFDRFSTLGQHMADNALSEIAERVKEELHQVINSSPPPPNTGSTAKRKGHYTPLLESGGMADSDSVVVTRDSVSVAGRSYDAFVVKGNPNKTHERTGTSYEDILGIVHSGGGGIPPREIFTITYDKMRSEIEKVAIREVKDYLR